MATCPNFHGWNEWGLSWKALSLSFIYPSPVVHATNLEPVRHQKLILSVDLFYPLGHPKSVKPSNIWNGPSLVIRMTFQCKNTMILIHMLQDVTSSSDHCLPFKSSCFVFFGGEICRDDFFCKIQQIQVDSLIFHQRSPAYPTLPLPPFHSSRTFCISTLSINLSAL